MSRSPEPTVIKLGGSLLTRPGFGDGVRSLLDDLQPAFPLIVPGGGLLTDQIRRLDGVHRWPDAVAHDLAIRTLSVTARIVAALVPRLRVVDSFEMLPEVWQSGECPVLDPAPLLLKRDSQAPPGAGFPPPPPPLHLPLPPGWDVTSDSIAAWFAAQFRSSRLVLVKSLDLPQPLPSLTAAAEAGLVDVHFPRIARTLARVDWINLAAARPVPVEWMPMTR